MAPFFWAPDVNPIKRNPVVNPSDWSVVTDFLRKWVCCATVDDQEVVNAVMEVRKNPDHLAEELVDYTHDSIVHHITDLPERVCFLNNSQLASDLSAKVQIAPGIPPLIGNETNSPMDCSSIACVQVGDMICPVFTRQGLLITDLATGASSSKPPASPDAADVPIPKWIETTLSKYQGVGKVAGKKGTKRKDGSQSGTSTAPPTPPGGTVVDNISNKPSSVYRACQDVVEVKNHRRINARNRGNYVAAVVSEIKNRLGPVCPTAANKLVVRRMANNIMQRHGVRPTHIREIIERVTAGVFVMDSEDLLGARMLASNVTGDLRAEVDDAGPRTAWGEVWASARRSFGINRRRPADRPSP